LIGKTLVITQVEQSGVEPTGSSTFRGFHGSSIPDRNSSEEIRSFPIVSRRKTAEQHGKKTYKFRSTPKTRKPKGHEQIQDNLSDISEPPFSVFFRPFFSSTQAPSPTKIHLTPHLHHR
jgi:hypothetical protein